MSFDLVVIVSKQQNYRRASTITSLDVIHELRQAVRMPNVNQSHIMTKWQQRVDIAILEN